MKRILLIAIYLGCILLLSCYQKKSQSTQVITLAETNTSWNGAKLPKYPDGDPKVKILKITIPPKSELPRHSHPVINAGVLLKGELTVVDENENVLYLKAGDAIVELVNTVHYGKNEGDIPAEIVVFYVGTEDTPVTVLEKEEN